MTGSVFSVLDITRIPAQAEVILKTDSTLTAALSLLDEPPFQFLTKAGREVQIGEGNLDYRTYLGELRGKLRAVHARHLGTELCDVR